MQFTFKLIQKENIDFLDVNRVNDKSYEKMKMELFS